MKFLPGDIYSYDSVRGEATTAIRTDEDKWILLPTTLNGKQPLDDEYLEFHFDLLRHEADWNNTRRVFIRRGCDILPEIMLDYADNIQF